MLKLVSTFGFRKGQHWLLALALRIKLTTTLGGFLQQKVSGLDSAKLGNAVLAFSLEVPEWLKSRELL